MHSYIEGICIELGNFKNFGTYTADPSAIFKDNIRLHDISALKEILQFTYPEIIQETKRIDVVWFNKKGFQFPQRVFEVVDSIGTLTDALFRYLRATGLVNISHVGKSLSIAPEKVQEVDYFLEHTDREPCFVDDEKEYAQYLVNQVIPQLFTDNKDLLLGQIQSKFSHIKTDSIFITFSITELKNILYDEINKRKEAIINEQITEIKDYHLYDDINITFKQIANKSLYDAPLMLEWNTWRAMTMLDGGQVTANFYALHKMNISYYGGQSTIVPLPLNIFQKMVEDSYKSAYIPQPQQIKRFFERSNEIAATSVDEKAWYKEITAQALNWLR